MTRIALLSISALALTACTTTPTAPNAPAVNFVAAQIIAEPVVAPAPPAATSPLPREPRERRAREPSPVQALAAANTAARQRSTPDAFDNARHVFSYQEGALYELIANPNYVSTILLEPGETLSDIAAGDTSRWMVTEAMAETEADGRAIIMVKPQTTGLRTNIVLITDRRTYLIEAVSQAGEAYAAQISWTYPQAEREMGAASITRLNFGYQIRTIRGRAPVWAPTRVFDDGRRTWIEFAPEVAAADMPPLFVVTGEGAEIVNYRVEGQRYEIDRVFDIAELRLGVRAPIIVRIERDGLARRTRPIRRGPRS
ncbi:MAG: P-type conjugative transfer protein TrbG [Alphaproteobacteria bacterium]|nr:MAG: P-type conjugative transfer protein TrbG [Alphaproteobacteria bacterium]